MRQRRNVLRFRSDASAAGAAYFASSRVVVVRGRRRRSRDPSPGVRARKRSVARASVALCSTSLCVLFPKFFWMLVDRLVAPSEHLGFESAILSSPVRSAVRQYSIPFVWMLASKSSSSCLPWAVLGLRVSHSPVTREVCRQTVFHTARVDAGKQIE